MMVAADEEIGKKYGYTGLIYFIACFAIVNLCGILYIAGSKFIYYWDSSTYWEISSALAAKPLGAEFFKSVYESVGELDYNYFAGLISALAAKAFGNSRMVYVLGILNFYTLPSFMVIYSLAKRICRRYVAGAAAAVLATPVIMFAGLAGFADVGGVLICLICYRLYWIKTKEDEKLYKSAVIGLLLPAAILFRRYFAFFSLSFITAMIGDCIIFGRKKLNTALVILETAAVLALFPDFVFNKLAADYGSMYSSYKFAFSTDLKILARYYGVLALVLIIGGSAVCAWIKRLRSPMFVWIQMGVCFFMFTATQTHGQQHLLMYAPGMITLLLILFENIKGRAFAAAAVAAAALNTVNPCIPRTQPQSIREISRYALLPDFDFLPPKREDTEEIYSLKQYLNTAVPQEARVMVLASSFVINDDILRKCEISLNRPEQRPDYLTASPCVDSRDTDIEPLFEAPYMLAAFPAQTHLGEENQQIIVQAVKSFEEGSDFAQAFEAAGGDMSVNGITLRLYRRTRRVTDAERYEFKKRLAQAIEENK